MGPSPGPVYYSRDLQILYLAKKTLKLGPTVLFTHLKIILLQCFQFSIFNFQFLITISSIQMDPIGVGCANYSEFSSLKCKCF